MVQKKKITGQSDILIKKYSQLQRHPKTENTTVVGTKSNKVRSNFPPDVQFISLLNISFMFYAHGRDVIKSLWQEEVEYHRKIIVYF